MPKQRNSKKETNLTLKLLWIKFIKSKFLLLARIMTNW